MPTFVQKIFSKIISLWTSSSTAQRILVAGLATSTVLIFFLMIFWLNRTEYKVLYSNLYQDDAARVVAFLEKEKVKYKFQANGSTILVPENKVYNLRLALAGAGALHGQGMGFEIFDETKIGQTNFIQHINYQRALQGELGRTIAEFSDIISARVHLVIPDKSLFIEEQAPTSASVILDMKSSRTLSREQVQSIVNLISTGVQGMTSEHITISTTKGKILYQPKSDEAIGLTSTQFEYQHNLQQNLEQRIEQMLAPIMGQDRVIAKVNADLDFSRTNIHEEIYDPNSAVVRSEQRSEEESKGTATAEKGTPEPNYQKGNGGSGTTQASSHTTSTTNFEINKVDKHTVTPIGKINRLSVAVIVDGTYEKDKQGKYVYKQLPPTQIARIRSLIEKAVGFDSTRGDSIEVSNISFGKPRVESVPTLRETVSTYFKLIGKPLLNALLILLFLLLVVRPVIMAIIKPKVSSEKTSGTKELAGSEERMALAEGIDEEAMQGMEDQSKIHDARAYASQLVEQNMDQAVMIIKKWITKGE